MKQEFTQEELTTIYRWADKEERGYTAYKLESERLASEQARRIKAKVSAMLAETPSQRVTVPPTKTL